MRGDEANKQSTLPELTTSPRLFDRCQSCSSTGRDLSPRLPGSGGPAAWPWYLSWGIALVAACQGPQRWRWLPLVIAASSFLVRADGQLVLPRSTAPIVLAVYVAAVIIVWIPPNEQPETTTRAGSIAGCVFTHAIAASTSACSGHTRVPPTCGRAPTSSARWAGARS